VASSSEGQEAFLEGDAQAFERLGGCPRRIRYDNLRPAVARILRGARPSRDRALRRVPLHYGFDSFFCEPGEAGSHEKGGVEGEVGRFRRRHLVPVAQVASLAEANALLARAGAADDARHVEGRRQAVGAMATAERPFLQPLPAEPFDVTTAAAQPQGRGGRRRGPRLRSRPGGPSPRTTGRRPARGG
jgi:hypothetical protein